MSAIIMRISILASSLVFCATAFSQEKTADLGKNEFEIGCAVCHGLDAKGNGMVGDAIKVKPADLTTLAKRNGGVFPTDYVTRVIDGREDIKIHGSRDMPIWGTRFSINAAEHYVDVPYDQEAYVRSHVLRLVDYLYRIQQK
jgi:mono/diheme cytochrome c family protein